MRSNQAAPCQIVDLSQRPYQLVGGEVEVDTDLLDELFYEDLGLEWLGSPQVTFWGSSQRRLLGHPLHVDFIGRSAIHLPATVRHVKGGDPHDLITENLLYAAQRIVDSKGRKLFTTASIGLGYAAYKLSDIGLNEVVGQQFIPLEIGTAIYPFALALARGFV